MPGPMAVLPRVQPAPEPAPAPPPSLIETVGLQFGLDGVGPDWGLNQLKMEGHILGEIRGEAIKHGYDQDAAARAAAMDLAPQDGSHNEWQRRADDLLAFAARQRAADPKFLAQYAGLHSYADVAALVRQQRQQQAASYSVQLQDSPFLGRLIGDLGHGFTDPVNFIPIGGAGAGVATSAARRIGGAMLRTAAGNVALTGAEEPFIAADARSVGEEHGANAVLADLGTAGLFGLTLGGLHAGGGELIRHWHGAGTAQDRLTVAGMEAAVPRANWTPDERAAAHVLTRTSDIAETSPFVPGGAGDAAHAVQLDTAYRVATDTPAGDVPRVTQPVSEGAMARDQVKAHIRRAESSGDDHAVNPDSSASGRFQFTLGTWLGYYKRRYGTGGLSNDAIWAKRYDPNLQEVLETDLLADAGHRLRAAGQAETPGNLYLYHFLGPDGLKVLAADGATPLEHLLPARDFAKNKVLRGKTAAEIVAWADRRMGGKGEVHMAAAEAPHVEDGAPAAEAWPEMLQEARDFTPERDGLAASDLPNLRAGLFGTPEEHAAAQLAVWREISPPAAGDAAGGSSAAPARDGPVFDLKAPERAPMRRSGPVDVMQAIADAGGLRDDEGHDLAAGRNIPRFIRGAGVILPKEGGRSIDAIGEHLWERGYFGPPSTTKRPREAQVLDLIEQGARGRVFTPEHTAIMAERAAQRSAQPEDEARWELEQHAAENGLRLDPRTLDEAMMHRASGDTVEGAVARAVHEAAFRDGETPAGLDRFEDPDGEGATAQTESIEHDLRMVAEQGDEGGWRLEEEGGTVSLAELFEQIDDDVRAAEALRACMAPMGVAAE